MNFSAAAPSTPYANLQERHGEVQEVIIPRICRILVALGSSSPLPRWPHRTSLCPIRSPSSSRRANTSRPTAPLQSSYVYVETRRELKLTRVGVPASNRSRFSRAIPAFPAKSAGSAHRRGWPAGATGRTGEAGSGAPAESNEIVQRLARNSSKELARQQRELQRARRERDEAMSDVYDVFEIRMIGRERVEEHDTIVYVLTPRREARPTTRAGEEMRHFSMRAWISDNDHELVKLEAEAIDNLRWGLGGLARLHKGARLCSCAEKSTARSGCLPLSAIRQRTGGSARHAPAQRDVRVFRLSQVTGSIHWRAAAGRSNDRLLHWLIYKRAKLATS